MLRSAGVRMSAIDARPRAKNGGGCRVLDVKVMLLLGAVIPLVAAGFDDPQLNWALFPAACGAYVLAALEVIAMIMGANLSAEARRYWWALMFLRFTVGLPMGFFGALQVAQWLGITHLHTLGAVAFVLGMSGLALKPSLDRVLQRKIEQLP